MTDHDKDNWPRANNDAIIVLNNYTNPMREEFEAAYEEKARELLGEDKFDRIAFVRGADGLYVISSVQTGWWAWKASRASLVIELPQPEPFRSREDTLDDCRAAIEAAGLKVKP